MTRQFFALHDVSDIPICKPIGGGFSGPGVKTGYDFTNVQSLDSEI